MIGVETSVASPSTPTLEMSTQRTSGRGFQSRGANAAVGRGSRGSAPGMETEIRTRAKVYAVTHEDADAADYYPKNVILHPD